MSKERKVMSGKWIVLLLLALFFVGCKTAVSQPPTPHPLPTLVQTAVSPTRPSLPTPLSPLPTSLPTHAPIAMPTIPPSPTSAPPLQIAVLLEWETAVKSAIAQTEQAWELIIHENPAVLLENGAVDAALAWNADGTLIYQDPIALTVPFTTFWDEITLAEAEEILLNEDELVMVQLWSTMMPTRKALRINGRSPADQLYPLQNRLMLTATTGIETAVSHLAQQLQANQTPNPFVQLTAVGDIMLDRALGTQISAGNLNFPFAQVADTLRAADLTIGNMESALGNIGTPADKSYPFRAPPAAAQSLAAAGFDIVSLANNHGMDYGPDALLQGIDLLQAANVAPVGAGVNAEAAHAPHIVTINRLTLAIFGYVNVPVEYLGFDTQTWTAAATSPGLAWAEPERIMQDLTAVSAKTDLIIVILHSGYEYVEAPSSPQTAAAHAAIDAGADLVIGHHAHILQGVEYYGDGVILYGLGNFAFQIDGPPETAVYNIWLDKNGVRELQFIPAIVQFGGQPRLATPEESISIQQTVYRLTNLLNP